MSLFISKPGLLDTIQDGGRYGYSSWGVNQGGVMDPAAARVANMLVGNGPAEPVIEMHFPGPHILFEQNALISICGGDFQPLLDGEPLPLWQPIVVRKGTVLRFAHLDGGARTYLAVHGGLRAQSWLNSYSTHLKLRLGGFQGRKLEKGDELPFRENTIYYGGLLPEGADYRILPWRADVRAIYDLPHSFFIMPGHEYAHLEPASREALQAENFILHPSSDRMGYNLRGTALQLTRQEQLLSSGVGYGTLQLLPNGRVIILMADHQTTGGYPRIGHVIAAHWPKLAQLKASDPLQFKLVDQQEAEEIYCRQQQDLAVLQWACFEKINQLVC